MLYRGRPKGRPFFVGVCEVTSPFGADRLLSVAQIHYPSPPRRYSIATALNFPRPWAMNMGSAYINMYFVGSVRNGK